MSPTLEREVVHLAFSNQATARAAVALLERYGHHPTPRRRAGVSGGLAVPVGPDVFCSRLTWRTMMESEGRIDKSTEIRHLLRTVKTALELAVVARAPTDLLNRLARPAGLLEAVSQLPIDGSPAEALIPGLLIEARSAIDRWEAWIKLRAPAA
jgi:hypothetical protein